MADLVSALEDWYGVNCDGDWEHGWGVRISTLDNPGWSLEVNLLGTPLAGAVFDAVREERSANDWVHCQLDAGVFKGYGGPKNLREILVRFLRWSGAIANSEA
jgi:hypothetical protein